MGCKSPPPPRKSIQPPIQVWTRKLPGAASTCVEGAGTNAILSGEFKRHRFRGANTLEVFEPVRARVLHVPGFEQRAIQPDVRVYRPLFQACTNEQGAHEVDEETHGAHHGDAQQAALAAIEILVAAAAVAVCAGQAQLRRANRVPGQDSEKNDQAAGPHKVDSQESPLSRHVSKPHAARKGVTGNVQRFVVHVTRL